MFTLLHILLAFATFLLPAFAAPVLTVAPGDAQNGLKITNKNTVNATAPAPSNSTTAKANSTKFHINAAAGQLPLSLINNLPTSGAVNAYVTGADSGGRLVILKPDGTFFYPTAGSGPPELITENIAIPLGPQGSNTQITVPGYISSARIWFAVGELKFYAAQGPKGPSLVEPSAVSPVDPSANVNWGFVELTYNADGIYANISYVDFLGLILGMKLTTTDGNTQGAKGLHQESVASVCQALADQQAKDGAPWSSLCQADSNGNMLRVLAPTDAISNANSAFSTYWNSYIDQVWSTYSSQPLYINTQSGAGTVSCQVQGDQLQCAGDNRGYAKPSAIDIFGCNSGPFGIIGDVDNAVHAAIVPRLCAAFHRSTLLLPGGNTQPSLDSSKYYTSGPSNFYSKFIHQNELDGKGYAFAYDDVNPEGENQSGTVAGQPQLLTVYVGGDTS